MYRMLFAGTALAALATPLAAQTGIDDARTSPVRTSDLANGQGDDLKIGTNGSITLTAGTAITLDSDHDVTNDGKITVTNAAAGTGIHVAGPRIADMVSNGTIIVDETYTPADSDNDGDLDGPLALGSGRAGIRVEGPLTGKIVHGGSIMVEGNQSAGIAVNGPLTGTFTHEGKTVVTGNQSVGVAVGDISGKVRLAGQIVATGEGTVGARLSGDLGEALVVQSEIVTTGYRKTTAPADPSKLDGDDLLQGGSALVIEGNVAKGIVFEVAPKDSKPDDKDEDKDGIQDDKEGNARIVSYGAAPAVLLGATDHDIAVGGTQGTATGFGIILDGTIIGAGVYSGVSGTGMAIGGRGGAVTVAAGMLVDGSIAGEAKNANATGLLIGAGTVLPELRNADSIAATVTGSTGQATAVLVDVGASLPLIKNSGTIKATTVSAGTANAILDRSGTLASVENSGKIVASGAAAGSGRNVAIDLSARDSGATVKQTAVAAGVAAPLIEGDIRFGGGADFLDLADGTVKGQVSFGAGADRMVLSGDAVFSGTAVFGGQADELSLSKSAKFSGTANFGGGAASLAIADHSVFDGRLLGAQDLAVSVSGGVLVVDGATTIGWLEVGAAGVVGATLGSSTGESTAITVNGTASFAQGSKIRIRLTDIADAVGDYDVITAGALVGADKLAADSALVPFMYKAALAVAGNTISVSIGRKATGELGLNRSEAAAFDELYTALAEDEEVANIFLGIGTAEVLQAYVGMTLPDHAGGGFEGLSQGLRAFDRHLMDPVGPFAEEGKLRLVADFGSWKTSKDRGDSAAYDLDGLGFRGGLEYLTRLGAFGITGSWIWNEHEAPFDNSVVGNSYEGGVHWRGKFGPVSGYARAGIGKSDFNGSRRFAGGTGENAVALDIARGWTGDFVSATGGISVEGGSQFFFFRPSIVLDYLSLKESGYAESGGGEALNLTVAARESEELGANFGMAGGVDLFGMKGHDDFWTRIEAEGGWRELLSSDLGRTTAHYADGEDFVLLPEQRDSGWFARLRGFGGDGFYTIGGEVGAEEQFGNIGYNFRASLRFSW